MAGTIAEIAAECGVSEQAVRGWCRRNHVAKDAKGSFAISESQKTAIYQHYLGVGRNQVSQSAKLGFATCETSETALISMLQKELDRKNEQLSVKDKQIEELNARLAEISSALVVAQQTAQAAQALHAGTIRQQLTDGDADPDVHSQEPEEGEEKKGWLSRLFGR
jgi:predicted transcriptional regulator